MAEAIVRYARLLGGTQAPGGPSVSAGLLQAETVAWVNQVQLNSGTVSVARQALVDALIVGLKANGIWAKLDRLWLLAAENTPAALTDLVGLTLAVANGSPAFAVDDGYTGVDASSTVYLDTGFNASAAGGLFSLNSAHYSVWGVTNAQSSASGGAAIGHLVGGNEGYIYPYYSDGNSHFAVNDGTHDSSSGATIGSSQGHWIVSRTASNAKSGYRNGSNVYGPVSTPTSAASLSNMNTTILMQGGTGAGSAVQYAMASIGGGLDSTDASNLYSRLRTYMTAIGVP
jgi:hypothetical protein